MDLLLAEERFLKIKQAMKEEQNQPEVMQELLLKLMDDLQILKSQQEKKETAAQSFIPYWNFSMIDDEEARDNFLKDVCTFLRKFSLGNLLTFYDNDDDEYTIIYSKPKAITPDLPIEEPDNSLSMGDEHLDTIPSVENLVPIPSELEGISDDTCDVPDYEEIISPKIDPHYFNAESNLIESLLNRDILIDSSPKFDYLLEEFSGELAHIDPIPPGIEKADFDLEEEIRLVDNLLYNKSSLIPVTDSDSLMEEINLFLTSDDSMPPGIEDDDYDSEGDIRFLEELLNNDSLPLSRVRILQKSQENGQNRTNTDTGKEREYKSRENAIKGQQKSTLGQY
ncbi:hypothetical protein Tco_1002515 [Tanacetum coccineum]|uniref:Uncharacterized protein n=1 Tax=Tanacetum coccineum TaxID=301880 RepID=A0ABQ5F6S0_9ASTR